MARKRTPKLYEKPRTCGGKNCYSSKHEAETVKAEQEIMKPELELSVYHCHLCGQWHLTRNSRAQ